MLRQSTGQAELWPIQAAQFHTKHVQPSSKLRLYSLQAFAPDAGGETQNEHLIIDFAAAKPVMPQQYTRLVFVYRLRTLR
jgi:hypothetical protein